MSQAPTDQANADRDELVQSEYRKLVAESSMPYITGELEQIARSLRQKVCNLYIDELGRDLIEQIATTEQAAEDAAETAADPLPTPAPPPPAPVEAGTIPPPAGV